MKNCFTLFKTKFGWVGMSASENGFTQTTLPMLSKEACYNRINPSNNNLINNPDFFKKYSDKITRYFDGQRIVFDEKLDYSNSSKFSRLVWDICRSIPLGETRSYKWIASKLDNPNSARAVGQVMSNNRFPLIVPCHRVVSQNGRSSGFGGSQGLDLYLPNLRYLLLGLESRKSIERFIA